MGLHHTYIPESLKQEDSSVIYNYKKINILIVGECNKTLPALYNLNLLVYMLRLV